MYLLICIPVLLVVVGYLQTRHVNLIAGSVPAVLVPAIGYILMIWLMMRMMDHGFRH